MAPESTLALQRPESDHPQTPEPRVTTFPAGAPPAIHWKPAFGSCLIAAAAATISLFLVGRVPVLILLVLPAGGWFAVFLYARRSEHLPLSVGQGARIGAVTGLAAFGLYGVCMAAVLVFQRAAFLEEIKKALTTAAAQNPNPQAKQVVENLMSAEGIAALITISAIVLFFLFLVLCSVGGAIGGSMAKGKNAA